MQWYVAFYILSNASFENYDLYSNCFFVRPKEHVSNGALEDQDQVEEDQDQVEEDKDQVEEDKNQVEQDQDQVEEDQDLVLVLLF